MSWDYKWDGTMKYKPGDWVKVSTVEEPIKITVIKITIEGYKYNPLDMPGIIQKSRAYNFIDEDVESKIKWVEDRDA